MSEHPYTKAVREAEEQRKQRARSVGRLIQTAHAVVKAFYAGTLSPELIRELDTAASTLEVVEDGS